MATCQGAPSVYFTVTPESGRLGQLQRVSGYRTVLEDLQPFNSFVAQLYESNAQGVGRWSSLSNSIPAKIPQQKPKMEPKFRQSVG
jgi:hypothetical protein